MGVGRTREANGTFEIVEFDIAAGDTVAFAAALRRCGSKAELAKNNRPRLRLTIAHEHHSFPADA
jgi:hypothetical protein